MEEEVVDYDEVNDGEFAYGSNNKGDDAADSGRKREVRYVNGVNPLVLFLARYPVNTTKEDIRRLFEQFGRVANVSMKDTFTLIDFEDADDASKAKFALHGQANLGTNYLICDFKKQPRSAQQNSGPRDNRRQSHSPPRRGEPNGRFEREDADRRDRGRGSDRFPDGEMSGRGQDRFPRDGPPPPSLHDRDRSREREPTNGSRYPSSDPRSGRRSRSPPQYTREIDDRRRDHPIHPPTNLRDELNRLQDRRDDYHHRSVPAPVPASDRRYPEPAYDRPDRRYEEERDPRYRETRRSGQDYPQEAYYHDPSYGAYPSRSGGRSGGFDDYPAPSASYDNYHPVEARQMSSRSHPERNGHFGGQSEYDDRGRGGSSRGPRY